MSDVVRAARTRVDESDGDVVLLENTTPLADSTIFSEPLVSGAEHVRTPTTYMFKAARAMEYPIASGKPAASSTEAKMDDRTRTFLMLLLEIRGRKPVKT